MNRCKHVIPNVAKCRIEFLIENPSKKSVIIDVRTNNEVGLGMIPTAHHIELSKLHRALLMPKAEFLKEFKTEKPACDTELIFYCHAGVRSEIAGKIAQQHGYQNVYNYVGSWIDWTTTK